MSLYSSTVEETHPIYLHDERSRQNARISHKYSDGLVMYYLAFDDETHMNHGARLWIMMYYLI